MNYRHIYHAGNVCDVAKHSVLALLVQYLREKDKPFAVLDTHAGCGHYDLTDPRALKTAEAETGIQRLWTSYKDKDSAALPATLAPYLQTLRDMNGESKLWLYPGSPSLTLHLMRAQDRLIACELHPEDAQTLRHVLKEDARANVHHRDGYEALKAFTPFPEKRGLILIDPPFEEPDEYAKLAMALRRVHDRFPQAVMAIWYPIKDRPTIWKFQEAILATGLSKLFVAEFIYRPEVRHDRLNGSGFLFVNPPWTLENQLGELFPLLHAALQTEAQETILRRLCP